MGIQLKAKAVSAVAFSSLFAAACGAIAPQNPAGLQTKQILPNATQVTLNEAGHRGVVSLGVPGSIFGGITPADVLMGYPPLGLSANIGTGNIVLNSFLQAQTGGFSPYVLPTSLQGTWLGALGWPFGAFGWGGLGYGAFGPRGLAGLGALGIGPFGYTGWGINPFAYTPVGHMSYPTAFWPNLQGIPYATTTEADTVVTLNATRAADMTPNIIQGQPVVREPITVQQPATTQ